VIPLDATLVKGSHGRLPEKTEDRPVLICGRAAAESLQENTAAGVHGLLRQICLKNNG
jgi:hypothetical protein